MAFPEFPNQPPEPKWWVCAVCPKCGTALPYFEAPGYDPADPVRTGLRGFGTTGGPVIVTCLECPVPTRFEFNWKAAVIRWLAKPHGPPRQ